MRTLLAPMLALLILPFVAGPAGAQDEPRGGPPGGEQVTLQQALSRLDGLPAQMRTGLRADFVRRAQQVVPVVVIVEDAPSYLEAIGTWQGLRRFPVLWDDGTAGAREDIARFVRAFEPEQVVLWRLPEDEAEAWPRSREDRQGAILRALGRALDMNEPPDSARGVAEHMTSQEIRPPGIVVTDPDDPAWTAGLALAAGRLQPLGFVSTPRRVSGAFEAGESDALAQEIERLAESTGLSWRDLGDDLDAVTLALNCPVKIRSGIDDLGMLATTDRIGRLGEVGAGRRWAWTGQVFGSNAQAAYRAMCALFLSPGSAWVFDSYPSEGEWGRYDGARAAAHLEDAGLDVRLTAGDRASASQWRALAARGLDAGLVMVNTKGNQDFFDLNPGQLRAGDVPPLRVPAMVYFVHSWSAARPTVRLTIGARWIEHGAYAYFGSVEEPYLQSFVPTPLAARRLQIGMPFAAALRIDDGPPWKLAVLGDPLITMGPAGMRLQGERTGLENGADLEETARAAVRASRFDEAIGALAMLGRDADAARLAAGLLGERRDAFTPSVARSAMTPLFRAGRFETMLESARRLGEQDRAEGVFQDTLWHGARALLSERHSDDALDLMRRTLRGGQEVEDALEIASYIRRRHDAETAAAYLVGVRRDIGDVRRTNKLDSAIRTYSRGR